MSPPKFLRVRRFLKVTLYFADPRHRGNGVADELVAIIANVRKAIAKMRDAMAAILVVQSTDSAQSSTLMGVESDDRSL